MAAHRSRGPASRGFARRRASWAVLPLSLFLLAAGEACRGNDVSTEPEDLRRAAALAEGDSLAVWPAQDAGRPVLLYVDGSRSMRGFLDSAYARVQTDYRSVLDGFAARLRPERVYGFGDEVREAAPGGLGVLGDPAFYTDRNTEMEDVLRRVEADSMRGSTHVIIGDGRRTDPDVANGQFVRMREVAAGWTGAGGTFIVAASNAPFEPVQGDASGCRASAAGGDAEAERVTCPLYAFAFVAPGDQGRVAAALAATFAHLYVTPLPALPETSVRLAGSSTLPITLRADWTKTARGAPIARVRGKTFSNDPLRAHVAVDDTSSPSGRGRWAALRGRRLVPHVSVRPLAATPEAAPWSILPEKGSPLLLTDDPLALGFVTFGETAPRYLHRVELHAAGVPAWLDTFDAGHAGDARRTYGLGRLFEGFSAADPRAGPPVLRLYVVAN